MNKTIICFLFMIILSTGVFAASPFVQESPSGSSWTIVNPKIEQYKLGTGAAHYHFHVYNSTGFIVTNATDGGTGCFIHVYDSTGSHIVEEDLIFDSNGIDFFYNATGTAVTKEGKYSYIVQCNSSAHSGFLSTSIEVVRDNTIDPEKAKALIFAIALFALILLFFANTVDEKEHWILKLLALVFVVICLFLLGAMAFNVHSFGLRLYNIGITFAGIFILYLSIFVYKAIMDQVKINKKSMKKSKK